MAKAVSRCSARRYWLTSMRSTRPDFTMYQPMAPCRPPSARTPRHFSAKRAAQLAHQPEHDERHGKGDADEAAEKAVRPLPPVDGLEAIERHAGVDDRIFGDRLVLLEGDEPVGLVERRDGAQQRLPFGDRQPAVGEAHGTADDDHAEDQRGDEPAAKFVRQRRRHGSACAASCVAETAKARVPYSTLARVIPAGDGPIKVPNAAAMPLRAELERRAGAGIALAECSSAQTAPRKAAPSRSACPGNRR